jgi:tRNA(Ile)-lysidine synthase
LARPGAPLIEAGAIRRPPAAGSSAGGAVRPGQAAAVRAAARYIEAERLLVPGERVLAACSGGPDSTALVLILSDLGYDVVVGHVDHAMRPGSAADAAHCRAVAGSLSLACHAVRLDPPPSGEAGARQGRYAALEKMRVAAGATAIATGHTVDDDAETVLLRLARGGFPLGIPPRRGCVVRPLLGLRRAEAAAECARRGVPVLADPSNADDSFARNRVRRQVLPGLGDAGIVALAATAASSRATAARAAAAAEEALARIATFDATRGTLSLHRPALEACPTPLRRAVLRRALAQVGIDPSRQLLEDLCSRLLASPSGRLDLPGGYRATARPGRLLVAGRCPATPRPPALLPVPGTVALAAWGLEVAVEVLDAVPDPTAVPGASGRGPACLLDAAVAVAPLMLRCRRPGDRFRPLGAPGERKLQDVLVDAKVPREERDAVPVVTSGDRVVWVVGQRIDDRCRVTAVTPRALAMRVVPLLHNAGGGAG